MAPTADPWRDYYAKALTRQHASKTETAAKLDATALRTAVDCGCGTGADIAYLSSLGYQVYGFDVNPDAVAICKERFAGNALVRVTEARFEEFDYPACGLATAHSSLFFADPTRFAVTWQRIEAALVPGGVFAGDFMGVRDDWAKSYRAPITALEHEHIERLLEGFDIIEFNERDEPGITALGRTKHWHMYSVVAVKKTPSQALS